MTKKQPPPKPVAKPLPPPEPPSLRGWQDRRIAELEKEVQRLQDMEDVYNIETVHTDILLARIDKLGNVIKNQTETIEILSSGLEMQKDKIYAAALVIYEVRKIKDVEKEHLMNAIIRMDEILTGSSKLEDPFRKLFEKEQKNSKPITKEEK